MKHINKILVFVISSLLVVIAVILMKDQAQKKAELARDTSIETDPLSAAVAESHNIIAADREGKLRGLADTPKNIKQTTVTTQTTTTTTTPKSSSSGGTSTSTKTS
jgi:hypothetical protein